MKAEPQQQFSGHTMTAASGSLRWQVLPRVVQRNVPQPADLLALTRAVVEGRQPDRAAGH